MTTTRRLTLLVSATLFALGVLTGPALAMQPPAEAAADRFGCVEGDDGVEKDAAVAGHPGAAGLTHSTPLVGGLTGDELPTAWNAVQHAEPIVLGGCGDDSDS